jgi:hypothetical protein
LKGQKRYLLPIFHNDREDRIHQNESNNRVDRSGGSAFLMVTFRVTPPPGHAGHQAEKR